MPCCPSMLLGFPLLSQAPFCIPPPFFARESGASRINFHFIHLPSFLAQCRSSISSSSFRGQSVSICNSTLGFASEIGRFPFSALSSAAFFRSLFVARAISPHRSFTRCLFLVRKYELACTDPLSFFTAVPSLTFLHPFAYVFPLWIGPSSNFFLSFAGFPGV